MAVEVAAVATGQETVWGQIPVEVVGVAKGSLAVVRAVLAGVKGV